MINIKEFQYPDGWYMRVGQIYSSPYEPYHVKITKIECNDEHFGNTGYYRVLYEKLNPRDYSDVWNDEDEEYLYSYAWWFNEGVWDLEKEPEENKKVECGCGCNLNSCIENM